MMAATVQDVQVTGDLNWLELLVTLLLLCLMQLLLSVPVPPLAVPGMLFNLDITVRRLCKQCG
jgi:hypothetical protein